MSVAVSLLKAAMDQKPSEFRELIKPMIAAAVVKKVEGLNKKIIDDINGQLPENSTENGDNK